MHHYHHQYNSHLIQSIKYYKRIVMRNVVSPLKEMFLLDNTLLITISNRTAELFLVQEKKKYFYARKNESNLSK